MKLTHKEIWRQIHIWSHRMGSLCQIFSPVSFLKECEGNVHGDGRQKIRLGCCQDRYAQIRLWMTLIGMTRKIGKRPHCSDLRFFSIIGTILQYWAYYICNFSWIYCKGASNSMDEGRLLGWFSFGLCICISISNTFG